ncbi:MAG: sensor histidine kinase [Betaproteobacteria bacterium]
MRLLPEDSASWTRYVWLVYMALPVWFLVALPASPWLRALDAIGLIAFLPLYFWGYWASRSRALLVIAGITILAIVLTPINPGASVLFIYASAFACRVGRPAAAVRVIGVILAIVAIETWLAGVPFVSWVPAIVFSAMVGGLNIHSAELGRANAKLRMAHAEVARLAIVAERERIARDLHDLLGHTLSVIVLKSELASRLAGANPERSVAEIRDVERISREALAEVRRAVQGYRTAGLADEIQQARSALDSAGVALACAIPPVRLAPEAERTLALAVREAVTNIVRHARAAHCSIRLHAGVDAVRLEIQDDGVGGAAPEGSGLSGMRARVVEGGGRLERDGRAGTRLTITLPATAARASMEAT